METFGVVIVRMQEWGDRTDSARGWGKGPA